MSVSSVPAENAALRAENVQLQAMVAELRETVADLRKQIEAQHAHIHRLVKLTFGRGGERIEGPTLFDGLAAPASNAAPPAATPTLDAIPIVKRKGHGRRRKPQDLPWQWIDIDLSEAEKRCACWGTAKVFLRRTVTEVLRSGTFTIPPQHSKWGIFTFLGSPIRDITSLNALSVRRTRRFHPVPSTQQA